VSRPNHVETERYLRLGEQSLRNENCDERVFDQLLEGVMSFAKDLNASIVVG
jgi:hypothetical protein